MSLEYVKAEKVRLSDVGRDEYWLQDQIAADPAILGLGDLVVLERERAQSSGGRIDFLMKDPDNDRMFEVEIQLGKTDESHIVRTIEYWDVERSRWPDREHRAVIVAEEITNRFFNVIALFSKAIPVIAIQLNALRLDNKLILDFTKVLDIYEPAEDEEGLDEAANRAYWEGRTSAASLAVVDQFVALLEAGGLRPRLTYKKSRIALGTADRDFTWFYPRRQADHCLVNVSPGRDAVDALAARFDALGLGVSISNRRNRVKVKVTGRDLKEHAETFREIFLSVAQRAAVVSAED